MDQDRQWLNLSLSLPFTLEIDEVLMATIPRARGL